MADPREPIGQSHPADGDHSAAPGKEHVFLALLPLFHVFGLTITLLLPARMAAPSGPHRRGMSPADMLEAFKKYQFTAFIGAPSVYISLLQQKNL